MSQSEAWKPSPFMEQAASNLVALRRKRRISAQGLSDGLMKKYGYDMSRASIANLEIGRAKDFSLTQAVLLADFFQVSLEWFISARGVYCLTCSDVPPEGFACLSCGKDTKYQELTDGDHS